MRSHANAPHGRRRHARKTAASVFLLALLLLVVLSIPVSAEVTNLTAGPAVGVTNHEAELTASYTGDGHEVHYYFEWGPTAAYGNTVPASPGTPIAPVSGPIAVPPVTISGLQEGATYHFRAVASDETGTTTSADQTVRTAESPVIEGLNSRNVTGVSAEIIGAINPRFGATTYHFEWGPTTAYGNSIPVPEDSVGSGGASVPVSAQTARPDQRLDVSLSPCGDEPVRDDRLARPDLRVLPAELSELSAASGNRFEQLAGLPGV